MYYNNEIKLQFLSTLETSQQNRYKRLFQTISSIENKRNKDVAEQDIEETLSLLQQSVFLYYAEYQAMTGSVGLIIKYKTWYKGIFGKNIPIFSRKEFPIDKIDLEENYPLKFVKDGNQLLVFLQQIFPDSESTRNFTINLAYLLIFNGITIEEMAQIKRTQVNFINKTISIDGFSIRMIPEFEPYYKQAIQLSNLVSIDESGKVKLLPVNPDFFFPMAREKRTWKNSFSYETQKHIEKSDDILNQNREAGTISVLDVKVLAINGILYRTHLELTYPETGYISCKDKKSKSINKFFLKYNQVFYK